MSETGLLGCGGLFQERGTSFSLITGSSEKFTSLPPNPQGDSGSSVVQTVEELKDEEALNRIQSLCRYQKEMTPIRSKDFRCENFVIRGSFRTKKERLVTHEDDSFALSDEVASSIIEFFYQEAMAGKKWNRISVSYCQANEPLLRVLRTAKALSLFSSWHLWDMESSNAVCTVLIEDVYCAGQSSLEDLVLGGYTRASVSDLCSLLDTRQTTTRLRRLELRCFQFREVRSMGFEAYTEVEEETNQRFANCLSNNNSLETLSLSNFGTTCRDMVIRSLAGHPTLITLDLSKNRFSQGIYAALGCVLKDPACRLKSLDLGFGQILYNSLAWDMQPFAIPDLVSAIQGCQSIERLCLSRCKITASSLGSMMEFIDSCPNLRELDLTCNKVDAPFWSMSAAEFAGDNTNSRTKTSPSKAQGRMECIRLSRNTMIQHLLARFDQELDRKIHGLLRYYPSLGQLHDVNHDTPGHDPFVPLSMSTLRILAFNYIGRGRLDGQRLPPELWSLVLNRVGGGVRNATPFMDRDHVVDLTACLTRSSQASTLFAMLMENPLILTNSVG